MNERSDTGWSVPAATFVIELCAVELGVLTMLLHLCQIAGVSHSAYAIAGAGLALCSAFVVFRMPRALDRVPDRKAATLLLVTCLVSALIPLLSHRPDEDDSYYVPNVVYALAHPDEPLGFEIHFIYSGDAPFESLTFSTAQAYEYILSIASATMPVEYLDVYYIFAPSIVACLIPLASFLLISCFEKDTMAAVVGTVVVVGALLLMGETSHTHGNHAFTRAYQGRTLLLAVGMPAWAALAIDLLDRPRRSRWLVLALFSAGLTGASATATVLLPAMAIAIFVGHALGNPSPLVVQLRRGLLLASTLAYTIVFAGAIWSHSRSNLSADGMAHQGFPDTFALTIASFRTAHFTTLALLVASTILAALLLSGRNRTLFVAWMGVTVVIFLNPLTADFWISLVTPNLYWRLVFALPFPVAIGIAVSAAWRKLGVLSQPIRASAFALLAALLVIPHFHPGSSSVFLYGQGEYWAVLLGAPGHNLIPGVEDEARRIAAISPAGPMAAPRFVSGVIPMISDRHPQLLMRAPAEVVWLASRGKLEEGRLRSRACEFLEGRGGAIEDLESILGLHGRVLKVVVMRRPVWRKPEVKRLLGSYGFREHGFTPAHVVVVAGGAEGIDRPAH